MYNLNGKLDNPLTLRVIHLKKVTGNIGIIETSNIVPCKATSLLCACFIPLHLF